MTEAADPIAALSSGQAARAHSSVARGLLRELEGKTGGNFTVDQVIAAAQVHAMLAMSAATLASGEEIRRLVAAVSAAVKPAVDI